MKEEVYLQKALGFENFEFPHHCYKLEKVVYGLKQALMASYETLSIFLINSEFKCGVIDPALFRRLNEKHLILGQIYLDNNIFG